VLYEQVRDYIHSALYQPHTGYFTAKSDAVGAMSEPIRFDRFQGKFMSVATLFMN
jgi:hypothetical protein